MSGVALVTNVTSYAGPGAVAALLAAGHTMVCHDPSFTDAHARAVFEKGHPGAIAAPGRSPGNVTAELIRTHGSLDLVVSNDVHPLRFVGVDECDAADVKEACAALLVTPAALIARAATQMRRQGSGRIVLVTSASPARPEHGFALYAAVRAAATVYAKAAARELAPHGISVYAIAPNFLESDLYYPPEVWDTDSGRDRLRSLLPAGRLGTKEELGALVAFLAGGSADFLAGEVITFAGGWP
jgi:NAD(P)-dependent dehydrogenase (short-subunit alcohol dehydrogenase family)